MIWNHTYQILLFILFLVCYFDHFLTFSNRMDGETGPVGPHSSRRTTGARMLVDTYKNLKTFDKSLLVLPGHYISWMEANDRLAFKNECATSAYAAAWKL
jgi:hypothetical protein